MTPAHLLAVDIDLTEPTSEAVALLGSPDRGWMDSSRDLLHGLRVHETPMDTLPADLVAAFTKT